jgi:hypothetical protein
MPDFFAPMPDMASPVMRPIDPLLLVEDGYATRPYEIGLGRLASAPVDPLIPSDVFTPTAHLFPPPRQGVNGLPEMLEVFNTARFLFEE